MENKYPEHDKLEKIVDESRLCGEFLDWLREEYILCNCDKNKTFDAYYPTGTSNYDILAKYFDINLNKLQQEKEQMLAEIRSK